jgi:hypothetical protein
METKKKKHVGSMLLLENIKLAHLAWKCKFGVLLEATQTS